jgi:hypothetical protein
MTRFTSIERDQLRRAVASVVEGRAETGTADILRCLQFTQSGLSGVRQADRRSVGCALRELGWLRDGFTGIGYDREPRFVAPAEAH